MKILIVAGFYPPYSPFAGTRVGKFAKYMLEAGHDVRVLSARNPRHPPTLKNEIPDERVIYSDFSDVNAVPGHVVDWLKGVFRSNKPGQPETDVDSAADPSPPPPVAPEASGPSLRQRLTILYQECSNIPDQYVGWYRHAVRAGRALLAEWTPDIIYTTVPPHTALLVANRLAQIAKKPWVAEFRDLWVHHPYYDAPALRRWVDRRLEKRTLRSVSGYVTVTASWAKLLEDSTGKPTILALNGFDPADFEGREPESREATLTLLYAGGLYLDKRDPTPLFKALKAMGDMAADVRIDFYVPEFEELEGLVSSYGISNSVRIHSPVTQNEILDLEARADALLLLRWDDPGENSVIAGKFFEYIGAGRPILSVGSTKGEVAEIIHENDFGVVTKDPEEIAATLRTWLAIKKEQGRLPGLDPVRRKQFERSIQFQKIESFLTSIIEP